MAIVNVSEWKSAGNVSMTQMETDRCRLKFEFIRTRAQFYALPTLIGHPTIQAPYFARVDICGHDYVFRRQTFYFRFFTTFCDIELHSPLDQEYEIYS